MYTSYASIIIFIIAYTIATPLTQSSRLPADVLIEHALSAVGGEDVLSKLTGVTYRSPSIYRSRSLMQSYELSQADTAVAIRGNQNISFDFSSDQLRQRIDRTLTPSDYWVWGSPTLDPFDFSLVVKSGTKGFACFVHGNNQIWLPPDVTSGYTDSALAEYLSLHSQMLSPKLLLKMKYSNDSHPSASLITSQLIDINGILMPSLITPSLDLTLILDPDTYLPYIVRTTENHSVYGPSTFDLYLSNYKAADGIMFPHQIQTIYNSSSQNLNAPLEDYIVEQVETNPTFPGGFFEGLPANESWNPPEVPKKVAGIDHAQLTEFVSNGLWSGITNATIKEVQAQQPLPRLPNVHWMILKNDSLGVKQLILEFENEVIVGDAPPQWTREVIEWIELNLKKPITHVWPTHHHRDHSGGVREYAALGAKLIVPEMAVQYWSSIPNATFVTYNETDPYLHADNDMQAWFVWQASATHASDWSYSLITENCITDDATIALFEADIWQAGLPREQSDQALMRQWLDQLLRAGVAREAQVLPTHGLVTPLTEMIGITGYPYPNVRPTNWVHNTREHQC